MPQSYSEIGAGTQFSRSSNDGQVADSQNRNFRIILSEPGEVVDIQSYLNVRIGDPHPYNANLYATSFDARYAGESRMVIEVTFNYAATPDAGSGQDPKSQPPDVRPAQWSISSALMEVPVYTWTPVNPSTGTETTAARAPVNAAGDRFETMGRYEPVVTISVQQFETVDPTRHVDKVGGINMLEVTIGSLVCAKYTLMLRGVTVNPVLEYWNDQLYKGWMAGYELVYRRNHVKGLWDGAATVDADIGWDLAVPQTGFNVIAFDPNAPDATQDIFGMPLRHENGKIWTSGGNYARPNLIGFGDKAKAMIRIASTEDNGSFQVPASQPIPLNLDGTPRASDTADPPVLVQRYRIYETIGFSQFNIRLQ